MGIFDFFNKNERKYQEEEERKKQEAHAKVLSTLEKVIGTEAKPAKVEKQKLSDGSIYSGEAILCTNGYYLPNGFGKRYINKEVEMTGYWKDGNANGVCYMNMHHSMITGHFIDSRPNGWCLNIEGGRGFVFGVFKIDDCVCSLGEAVSWMVKSMDFGLKILPNKKEIFVGEVKGVSESDINAKGFHFMNNGDVYVGMDVSKFEQTGFFFKFTKDGYIQIGLFEQGNLAEELDPKEVIQNCFIDPNLLKTTINTNKKYF